MAEEQGLEARYEPPEERRDLGATAAVTVVVYLGMKAVDEATDRALDAAADRLIAKWKAGRAARLAAVRKVGPRHRA